MQHFRDRVDRHSLALVQVRQGHDHHPLRAGDAEGLGPEVADLFEMHTDRGDFPGESPNDILILFGGSIHEERARFLVIP